MICRAPRSVLSIVVAGLCAALACLGTACEEKEEETSSPVSTPAARDETSPGESDPPSEPAEPEPSSDESEPSSDESEDAHVEKRARARSDASATRDGHKPGSTWKAMCAPDWPVLDLSPIRRTFIRRARRLNSKAIGEARSGDLAAALDTLVEAIETDPGHLLAWYNLAALHARAGDDCEALAALEAIATPQRCPWCRTRLVRARQDEDFAALADDVRFLNLTDVEPVPQPSMEDAADAIASVMLSQEFDSLAPIIHPRDTILITKEIFPWVDTHTEPYEGRGAFVEWVAESQKTFHCSVQYDNEVESCSPLNGLERGGPLTSCDEDGCCGFFESEEENDGVNHNTLFLNRICFETDVAGAIQLRAIHLWDSG